MRSVSSPFAGVLLAAMLTVQAAHGAGKSPDAVRAETLFDEGRRLMSSGDFAAACPKFAQSQALDPAPGTALNLANCYEKWGKLASAWSAYRSAETAATSAKQKDRAAFAKKKAVALQSKLSRLTVVVPAGSQTSTLQIRFDSEPVQTPEWGVPIPRDGGQYEIQASAVGKKTWTLRIDLRASGQNLVIEVPPLEDAPAPVAETPAPAPTGPVVETMAKPSKVEQRGGTQRTVGLVVAGIGVAGLATAGALAFSAKTQMNKAEKEGSPAKETDSQNAVKMGNIATVAAAVGGGLAATGLVIWLTAPRGPVTVGTNGQELFVAGTF